MDAITTLTAVLVLLGFLFTWIIGSGKAVGWLMLASLQILEVVWVIIVLGNRPESAALMVLQAMVFAAICVRNFFSTRYDIHLEHHEEE